jgi:hypothetical protein
MDELLLIGWREWLALPQLALPALKAKVDTGARSSSLHVDDLEEYESDGARWLRFTVATGRRGAGFGRRAVTDSGGHVTSRWFIRTTIRLAGLEWQSEINLTDRGNMLFPMLLGRTALRGRFRVDPQLSYACGRPRRRVPKLKANL